MLGPALTHGRNLHLHHTLTARRVSVTARRLCTVTHCPELYEILQNCGSNEQTVHQRVGQEEDEELVVGESDAVVHPADTQKATLGSTFSEQKSYQARLYKRRRFVPVVR